jgi:amidase
MTVDPASVLPRVRPPSVEEAQRIARSQFLSLSDDDIGSMLPEIESILREIEQVAQISIPPTTLKYPQRDSGTTPTPDEDPYNAFIRFCDIRGAATGALAGKRVGLKDNIRIAGVPMTNGSTMMPDYVPVLDAVIVERILDAGATIVGKLNMDCFGMGASGESSQFGPPRNPSDPRHSAGGSSGGSGAALAAGSVDIAIGVDQGGSARIPAAWCGVVGLKATQGLVPSFGISYMDHTLDHVCPMARTVRDVALTLEVIAGEDRRDPQWYRGQRQSEPYTAGLDEDVTGLRIGLIAESLTWPDSESDVNASVHAALDRLADLGAIVDEVSMPWWRECEAVILAILTHSAAAMVEADLEGYSRGGTCDPHWQAAFGSARRAQQELPRLLAVHMILAKHLQQETSSTFFSMAQNARVAMRGYLDEAFERFDVLVTPTTPMKAVRLSGIDPREGNTPKALFRNNRNTCPLNLTGHPALSVPAGRGENGLPIGIQLIGPYLRESLLLRVGSKLE